MTETQAASADAFAAFVAWPAPCSGRAEAPSRRTVWLSVLLAGLVCLALGAISFAASLLGGPAHALGLGHHLLLFCPLA
ncbi:MAG: hypothetical protein JOZ73_04895 [Solirubrobacterales bacterium]|nr:hypothetical protein [Solirubrobacterales bacterium]